jgi:hypothetical protein
VKFSEVRSLGAAIPKQGHKKEAQKFGHSSEHKLYRRHAMKKATRTQKQIKELATDIYNELAPWERVDTSVKEIADTIKNDPLAVIEDMVKRFCQ